MAAPADLTGGDDAAVLTAPPLPLRATSVVVAARPVAGAGAGGMPSTSALLHTPLQPTALHGRTNHSGKYANVSCLAAAAFWACNIQGNRALASATDQAYHYLT